jgi:hypothetical protein
MAAGNAGLASASWSIELDWSARTLSYIPMETQLMNDPFREWLKTDEGQRCMTWPVSSETYLQNRLWWAFNAGMKFSQFANEERDCSSGTSTHE